jgi:hypothetical protein
MLVVKGVYDGNTVSLERNVSINHECEMIVTFFENRPSVEAEHSTGSQRGEGFPPDDGSLAWLFRDYKDDGIREPIVDFGPAAGNERW